MSTAKARHIAVHINELVLPHGTRTPDQATLRRMVEAQLQQHSAAEGVRPVQPAGSTDVSRAVAEHARHHLKARRG